MATCKDCICFDILCRDTLQEDELELCQHFKNKADFVEVKRGEWIRPTIINGMTIAGLPHCSVCGEVPCDEGKYCPHCGAKMDGVKEE